jgi:hypothetical protein
MVVMKRGKEKCFCDSLFSTGDDGRVVNDHVVWRRCDDQMSYCQLVKEDSSVQSFNN